MSVSSTFREAAGAAMAVLVALSLSACGQSGGTEVVDLSTGNRGGSAEGPGSAQGSDQALVVPVAAYEYGYMLVTPVSPGTYTFELNNGGQEEHNMVIEGPGVTEGTRVIGPGETDSITVDLESGVYSIYSTVGNNRAEGMEVGFIVP